MPDTLRISAALATKMNNAKAVIADGSTLDRTAVLSQLGLDPGTPPDAWLTVVACGVNASALTKAQLQSLVASGKLTVAKLDAHSRAKLGQ